MTPRIGHQFFLDGQPYRVTLVSHVAQGVAVYYRGEFKEPNSGTFKQFGPEHVSMLVELVEEARVRWATPEAA